jgi:hypothetical protein
VYGVIVGAINSDIWLEIQNNLTRGQIRLYPAQDLFHGAEFIKVVIENLTNSSKLDVQKEFFKSVCLHNFSSDKDFPQELARIQSLPVVHEILEEAFSRIDIPLEDMNKIFESVESFEELLQIGYESIDNLPNFMQGIHPFFSLSPIQDGK